MDVPLNAQDLLVRRHIYFEFVERGHPPSAAETSKTLGLPLADVRASYVRLHDAHAIVLRHGDASLVRVAHPISAYPTPFWVTTKRASQRGNASGRTEVERAKGPIPLCAARPSFEVDRRKEFEAVRNNAVAKGVTT